MVLLCLDSIHSEIAGPVARAVPGVKTALGGQDNASRLRPLFRRPPFQDCASSLPFFPSILRSHFFTTFPTISIFTTMDTPSSTRSSSHNRYLPPSRSLGSASEFGLRPPGTPPQETFRSSEYSSNSLTPLAPYAQNTDPVLGQRGHTERICHRRHRIRSPPAQAEEQAAIGLVAHPPDPCVFGRYRCCPLLLRDQAEAGQGQ
ncbi:hypothetical protein BKA62DRAFT_187017 [Auriculariales sp. MPI-PUGE-AT-0066]|nr:hypothetical protein BKA62DRAFT_187017 [Auriculariales sp. MPI-PUGE-AT-0066]